jgi:biopolymer transport protein ExbD
VLLDTGDDVLVLKADKFVPYGVVIDIMDAVKGAGFRKVIAPTIMEEEPVK